MDTLLADLRYSLRNVVRQPSFALTAIATLALGIGATTAIFSVVNAVLLRPLPLEQPDRVVAVTNWWTKTGTRGNNVSGPDFRDWQAQSRSFRSMAYFQGGETSVTLGNAADYARVYYVSPEFFEALGVRASVGRLPDRTELANQDTLAVVTDAFARQHFEAGRAVSSTIKLDERTFTIVGVLAPGARYPAQADVYVPAVPPSPTASRSGHNYRAVARLADGVTLQQARDDLTAIARRLEREHPASNTGKLTAVTPLQELLVGSSRDMLLVLMGAVGLVLLIACANVANLLLARSTSRTREMVVRAAVGATRVRLVRQLLTESLVLGALAGLAGTWLARMGVSGLLALAPADLPRAAEVHVDGVTLAFALAIAFASSLLFGLAPALQLSSVQLASGLREGGKGTAIGARSGWARSAFVVIEVALAVVLVVGAGLLARSLAALAAVDMGFTAEKLLVLRTEVPLRTFADAPRATAFYRDVLDELRALPGVEAIGGVTGLPTAPRSNGTYALEGGPAFGQIGVTGPQALFTVVTPDYFRALKVPVTRGRDFSASDVREAPFVAIVNESLARASFPGQDPIGRRIQCGLDSLELMTIVGVVGDVRTAGPATPAQPELFMPYLQHPGPASSLNLVARTHADPLALAEVMRRKIAARNADVPVKAETMERTIYMASSSARFRTALLVIFAGVALLLALGGVYGVMAYTVSQRISELGVRIALGASRLDILRLVLGHGARMAVAGLALGIGLSLLWARVLRGMLFSTEPHDPLIFAAVPVVILIAALLACYIPSRRALRVDPMVALRSE